MDLLTDESHGGRVRKNRHAHAGGGFDLAGGRVSAPILEAAPGIAFAAAIIAFAARAEVAALAATAATAAAATASAVIAFEAVSALTGVAAEWLTPFGAAPCGRFGALGAGAGFLGVASTRPCGSHQQIGQTVGVGFVFGSAHGADSIMDARVWEGVNMRPGGFPGFVLAPSGS